jgi:outer membrane protein OmpA-like peptidoglycan-associated protein
MLLAAFTTQAQKKEADEKYKLYEFAKAIPLYQKHLSSNNTDADAQRKLGESFMNIGDLNNAISAYKTLVALSTSDVQDLYQLTSLLLTARQLEEANRYAQQYAQRAPGDKANVLLESIKQYPSLTAKESAYTILNKTADYNQSVFAAFNRDGIIYVTAENSKDNSRWTGRGAPDMYTTDASFSKLTPFAGEIMTKESDGLPAFTDGGNTMYFTAQDKVGVREGEIVTRKQMIYIAKLQNGKWKITSPFPYNNSAYNSAHATISSDGNFLIYASDKPGGKGGMDLYLCRKQGDAWTEPQNLTMLNTFGTEIMPTINGNELYFSSNGRPGLGAQDLFRADFNSGMLGNAENLGAPINSSYDDVYLSTNDRMQSGYISSNRYAVTDDVLSFTKAGNPAPPPPAPSATCPPLEITVLDKYTSTPLPYVEVFVKNDEGEVVQKGMSDEAGKLVIDELCSGTYSIQGELNGITTTIAKISTSEFASGTIKKELRHNDPRFTLRGVVINSATGKPLEGVRVKNANQTTGKEQEVITGPNGEFFFQLTQNSDFKVSGSKAKWLSTETADVTTKGLDRSKELYVRLSLNMQEPTADAVIRLNKIFYAYDKCDIRPVSAAKLDRLIKLMNDYPDMVIELGSHTDARGSDEYNAKLSQCRADAAVQYLLSKGIARSRLTAKGYGESKLTNECGNGVECTDARHEENRRTEFRIISCATCPRVE